MAKLLLHQRSALPHTCGCSTSGSTAQISAQLPRGCFRASRPLHAVGRAVATLAAAVEETQIESVADIENAPENQSVDTLYKRFDSLLEETMLDYNVGDRVHGTVSSVDAKGAYVDVGAKSPAWLPINEVTNFKVEKVSQVVKEGHEREFQVVFRNAQPRKGRHAIVVSLKEVERDLCWKRIQQLMEEKLSSPGKAIGSNSGGLFVSLEGIRGFCPGSHIPQNRKEDGIEALIGQTMTFSILEADQETERLVVSARTRMLTGPAGQASYKVGDVVLGTVQSVQPYGAFLDLGSGVTGLLHVSQISHDRVEAVADVLSLGDKIKVMVLAPDAERGRLSLSTCKLEPSPGDMLRDPALVFEKADEMAAQFRQRIAEAEREFGEGAYMNDGQRR